VPTRIILTQNVPNLGSLGDEVQVKDGYARNFLLPRGMAIAASGKKARELEHRRRFLEQMRKEAIDQAKGEAGKVAALELVFKARVGAGGRLFGSVTNRDLHAMLAERGFEVDRKAIQLHSPVKNLGTYTATVRLHTDVKVDVEFKVEQLGEEIRPEGEGEAAAASPESERAAASAASAAEGEATGAPLGAAPGEGDPAAAPAEPTPDEPASP
jgi:large subunit ribosomal protein L9